VVDHGGRAIEGLGLRPLACWGYGFEYRWGHGILSLVSVLCYQVDVSATGPSFIQSPAECGVSECEGGTSQWRARPLGLSSHDKKIFNLA
jgi:hypothetical protein